MADPDDDLVSQLRRALSVDRVGIAPQPAAPMTQPSQPPAETPPEMVVRRPAVGAAALGIADDILGFAPSSARTMARREFVLCRSGAIHTIPSTGIVLGRRAAPGVLVIDDRHVSREHARVVDIDGTLHIVDVGSSNGTAIRRGEIRIEVGTAAVALEAGDRIVTVNDVELIDVVEKPSR